MDLAKPCLDVGLSTDTLEPMRAFYEGELGLPFEELLPVGGGVRQYRFGLNGSVLKLNHHRDPVAPAPTGYRRLVVASPSVTSPRRLVDPDGLEVTLVPPGYDDVSAIGIGIAARDASASAGFLDALGADRLAERRYRLGTTVLQIAADASAVPAGAMGAKGFRYLTIQVHDVRAAHERLAELGVDTPVPPRRMGEVAMISFIRDPDGNWIELSQRASLTGPLPSDG